MGIPRPEPAGYRPVARAWFWCSITLLTLRVKSFSKFQTQIIRGFPLIVCCLHEVTLGELMVSMRVRDRESIQEAVRRFRKLVERSGLKREMRRRQYYEKPSEIKRRARLRAERRALSARRALQTGR